MDINWRQEYEAAVIERDGLIMALTAAEERESAVVARAEAAERRVAELEARLVDEWRPVTGDDLPDDHDEALVTVENEDGYRFVDMAEFTVGGTWWQRVDTGWRELKRVTHWRQLPPPPAATE